MIAGAFLIREGIMPTYEATAAHEHIKPEMQQAFMDALADADRQGQEVTSVIVANGVPFIYNVRDKA